MRAAAGRPIRVLHLGNATGLYGAERWILALARHLPAAEAHSIVAALDDAGVEVPALCGHAQRLGLPTQVFRGRGRLSFGAVAQLRDFVQRNGIDVVHTHGYKTDLVACLALAGTRCRLVSTPHGWTPGADWKLAGYEFLDRLAFACMDAVAPLSEALHAELQRNPLLRRKLVMIANGVDLDEVDAAAPAPGAAAPLADSDNAAADALTVGYVGRLVPGKRVDVLIDAFAALRLARKRLLIIGEGPQQESLQRQAQARGVGAQVTFTGYREDRLQLLASLDVFVLPSESEGIPRCLLEAMAASVPVIASDIPGCRALVRHGETGELFAVGDVAGLAGALQRAAASPAQRLARAAAGRRHVREHYSAAAMAEQYLALYRRLLPS